MLNLRPDEGSAGRRREARQHRAAAAATTETEREEEDQEEDQEVERKTGVSATGRGKTEKVRCMMLTMHTQENT